ncbi:MAG TPA: aminodeoxychorismate synthase, component I, partial [Erythrobacter sp.]|nr:aminodeoxychorismate synthase, component I [Erythrobacter sp.]
MAGHEPFVLLDDARESGASDAQLFERPRDIFAARHPEEVDEVLAAADRARRESGGTLAGYIGYEAGLAIEARLAPLAAKRSGATGPLVWLGLFDECRQLPATAMPAWLAERAGEGPAVLGPLDPQVSISGYLEAFGRLQEAIRAGDIYQANLTLPLAGPARGDPMAIYAAIRPAARAGY